MASPATGKRTVTRSPRILCEPQGIKSARWGVAPRLAGRADLPPFETNAFTNQVPFLHSETDADAAPAPRQEVPPGTRAAEDSNEAAGDG